MVTEKMTLWENKSHETSKTKEVPKLTEKEMLAMIANVKKNAKK